MKIEITSRKLRLILVVMSAALTFLPAYLSVEGQTQKKKATTGVNLKQKNIEVQTYTETVNRAGIKMVRVSGGKFMMGLPADENGVRHNDGPPYEVTISQSFYMGKYEVTQLQWRAVAKLPKINIDLPSDSANFKGDKLPVEQVSWHEAVEFCERLSRATGKNYRLPTEAEWEYACRAGTTGEYAGSLDSMAWYYNNSGSTTHPVGKKKPNWFGLYDMHGNVWEWCQDWYDYNYYSQNPGTNPTGPKSVSSRVIRGGCWGLLAHGVRSGIREREPPDTRYDTIGFRLVMTSN